MAKRRTIADRYEAAAMRMLKRHRITWEEQAIRRLAIALTDGRRHIRAPRPRTAMAFYVFAHEVAHVLFGHDRWPTTALGQADEVQADLWAMARLRRIRGYIPATVERAARAEVGRALRYLMSSGGLSLEATERFLRGKRGV